MPHKLLKFAVLLWTAGFGLSSAAQAPGLFELFYSGDYVPETADELDLPGKGPGYLLLEDDKDGYQTLGLYDPERSRRVHTLFSTRSFRKNLYVEDYRFAAGDSLLLLTTSADRLYRHSRRAVHFIYHMEQSRLEALSHTGKQMYPEFSPGNRYVAYVIENDLYLKDLLQGTERRITRNGNPGAMINGRSDWVYEEEFELLRAFEWQADGAGLLFLRLDESQVPEMSIARYDREYPYEETFRYPRAGQLNARAGIAYYDMALDSVLVPEIPWPYEYIPRIIRAGDGFAFLLLNRRQDLLRLIHYSPATDSFTLVYEESDPHYIELPTAFAYAGNGNYILSSERDGFTHLYRVRPGQISPMTSGAFEVSNFYGQDEAGWLYYQGNAVDASERHIYRVLPGGNPELLTPGPGTHEAEFSGGMDRFIHRRSAAGDPVTVSLRDREGKLLHTLETNDALRKRLKSFYRPKHFVTLPATENGIPAWIILPPGFDSSRTHPVLMYTYGGPGVQSVVNAWNGMEDLWFQHLAHQGFIVFCADNRGTQGYGAEYRKPEHRQLGRLGMEDQLAAARYLAEQPYVDGDRIAFYGWSYGAYLALLNLFRGNGLIQAALSVAPVTDWRFYDTIYTERYMGIPGENPDGYRQWSAVNAVAEWKEGELFLAHGTADDNVHFQHMTELIKSMNSLGKDYTLYLYPDGGHGLGSYWNQFTLYERMTKFLLEKL